MRFIGDGRPWAGIGRVREWIGRIEESYRARGYGRWAVAEREGGRVVGSCGFQLQPWSGLTDFGYMLAREAWGRGYATEIARAALSHGFERYGFAEVVASVAPENVASRRVLEKLGFVYKGTEVLPGEEDDSEIYVAKNPNGERPRAATQDAD
jgi:ribosomal-protein-alanine N-acetyltransferase